MHRLIDTKVSVCVSKIEIKTAESKVSLIFSNWTDGDRGGVVDDIKTSKEKSVEEKSSPR